MYELKGYVARRQSKAATQCGLICKNDIAKRQVRGLLLQMPLFRVDIRVEILMILFLDLFLGI